MEWRAGAATGTGKREVTTWGVGLRQGGKWDEDDERSKEFGDGCRECGYHCQRGCRSERMEGFMMKA